MPKFTLKNRTLESKILFPLIAGFVSLIIAMLLTWVIGMQQLNYLGEVIDNSKTIAQKMSLVASLIKVARSRTRLTMKMVHTDDSFDRDAIGIELDKKASEFAVLRNEWIALGLTPKEQDTLKKLRQLIKPTLINQNRAAKLAASDDIEKRQQASLILLNEVYPEQGVIVDMLMQTLHEKKRQLETSADGSLAQIGRNQRLNYLIFALVLTISGMIIFIVSRRISAKETELNHEKNKAQFTFRSIGDAIITTDHQGIIEYTNNRAETLIGKLSSEIVGEPLQDAFQAYDKNTDLWVWQVADKLVSGEDLKPLSQHVTLYSFDNIEYEITVAISPIVDIHGTTSGVIVSFHDVTQSHKLMEKVKFQAAHDALTGLLNRREYESRVRQSLSLYPDTSPHAMCIIDLDKFKTVNDSCGHSAGDKLLQQLATYLKPNLRRSDFFARLGGDEFGVFLCNIQLKEAEMIANMLLRSVREFCFCWNNKTFRIGASIGMIGIPSGFNDYEYLYKAADTACYLAKNGGRNQLKIVTIDDSTLIKKTVETNWLEQINLALKNNSFLLYQQSLSPISPEHSKRKYVEILLRMRFNNELVLPMAFLPIAERYGLMGKIDLWVFNQVCQFIANTTDDNTVYAINLSAQTLASIENMQALSEMLKDWAIEPERLCLEITESAAISNLEYACQFAQTMRTLGCSIALDDFGSGLSSFSYLKNLPLDYIKIDGTFIQSITDDQASLIMVDAIHSIGKKLGLITIAEFIESSDILKHLKKIGIDLGQGYYFHKPELFIEHNFPDVILAQTGKNMMANAINS